MVQRHRSGDDPQQERTTDKSKNAESDPVYGDFEKLAKEYLKTDGLSGKDIDSAALSTTKKKRLGGTEELFDSARPLISRLLAAVHLRLALLLQRREPGVRSTQRVAACYAPACFRLSGPRRSAHFHLLCAHGPWQDRAVQHRHDRAGQIAPRIEAAIEADPADQRDLAGVRRRQPDRRSRAPVAMPPG